MGAGGFWHEIRASARARSMDGLVADDVAARLPHGGVLGLLSHTGGATGFARDQEQGRSLRSALRASRPSSREPGVHARRRFDPCRHPRSGPAFIGISIWTSSARPFQTWRPGTGGSRIASPIGDTSWFRSTSFMAAWLIKPQLFAGRRWVSRTLNPSYGRQRAAQSSGVFALSSAATTGTGAADADWTGAGLASGRGLMVATAPRLVKSQ